MGIHGKIDRNIEKIIGVCVSLMFLMPLIPRGLRPVIIVALIISSAFSAVVHKQRFRWYYFLLNSSLFFLYLLSLSYSSDLEYGIRKLGTSAPLIVLPLAFCLMSKKSIDYLIDRRFKFMWLYVIAILVFHVGAFIKFYTHYSFNDVLIHYVNIVRLELGGWNIHPIYLSMHAGVAIIFSVFLFQNSLNWKRKIALIVMDLVLVSFLLIMIRKGPIIAMCLVLGLVVLLLKDRRLWIISGTVICAIAATVIINPKVNQRFSELLKIKDATTTAFDMNNSTTIRMSIYDCASTILPEAGFFGYGIGDGKNELIDCYWKESRYLAVNKYNSHNQYLGVMLKAGYVGLLVFSIFLLFHFLLSINKKNYILVALLLFYVLVMFSENILERENGVIYFSLFINFFMLLNFKQVSVPKKNSALEMIIGKQT